MSLRESQSIDDLYAAVANADTVISADAPLTLALDKRVTYPCLGRVAATPRSHATGELIPEDERELFTTLIRETDLTWKQVSRALELCLDCWNRTGSLERITDFQEFDTPAIRRVVDVLSTTQSSYRTLDRSQISSAESVAVIDEDSLTALDCQLLPADYESISPFTDSEVSVPSVHIYPSATDIVETLVSQIDADSAEQVGVVLDTNTVYSPLVEAALETQEIPYQGGPGFLADDDVRLFLRFVQTSFTGSGLTVGQLRPLLTAAGFDVSRQLDEQLIAHIDSTESAFSTTESFFTTVESGTFKEAISAYEGITSTRLTDLRTELSELGLLNRSVTEQRCNELIYYLQSFEVPVEHESSGVLLADAASTATVDRPVVFYLGLGEGWAQTPPDLPWVNATAFTDQDIRRFKRLIQNGAQRYYLVQDSRAGDEVLPCVYFRDICGVETFDDFEHVRHPTEPIDDRSDEFDGPVTPPAIDPIESISQSTLKKLVNSPRDHFFNRLVDSPTNLSMEQGTVLHEAAELYVNDKSVLTDRREELLTAMCDQLQPYISKTRREVVRTRLDAGLYTLTTYLDTNPPQKADFDTYDAPIGENKLAEHFGVKLQSTLCERWFRNESLGGHGVVDLLQDSQSLVDYKTGRQRSVTDVERQARLDDLSPTPDFQVLLYLAQHRDERPGEQIQMRFVHLLGAVHEIVKGESPDLDDLVTELCYVPWTFSEFVAQREVYDELIDYAESNDRRKVLDKLGYDWYRSFFESHALPRKDDAPERREEIREEFQAIAEQKIGSYAYVANGVEKIFGDLEGTPPGYLTKGDLDIFEEFLTQRLTELNQYRTNGFPISFDDDEPNWSRVDHRDLILTRGVADE